MEGQKLPCFAERPNPPQTVFEAHSKGTTRRVRPCRFFPEKRDGIADAIDVAIAFLWKIYAIE